MNPIPMASAELDQSDIDAVVEVLKSGHLALGPKVKEFEAAMQRYCGVKHAIAVNSGTSGLHLIMLALGIGPGDEVLVPSYTFVASVNCILYVGATPIFVDCDPKTFCFDVKSAEKKISKKTKALVVVDVFGHPADWDQINAFSQKHNLKVVDDCCEAIGAKYKGQAMGTFGDAGSFAFYPNKQMTTGEGGMIVTNNDEIASMCRGLRNQGREEMSQWLEHRWVGYNFRLDEMSAALGVSQLKRLDSFLESRNQVAQTYNELLANNPYLERPYVSKDVTMSWFVYVIKLHSQYHRDDVISGLAAKGIPARAYFSGIHTQQFLKDISARQQVHVPVTDEIQNRTLALPFHNKLTAAECRTVVAALNEVLAGIASKKVA